VNMVYPPSYEWGNHNKYSLGAYSSLPGKIYTILREESVYV
jgi:hypothetical protein